VAPTTIKQSTAAYERWLGTQLGGELVEDGLKLKHERMAAEPFPFLRATYWRWAETILDICPDLADAPVVLAVGDIHLENFGTWRDVEGRLIWGVNDFDEAAEMPYALDLVRLATSAMLVRETHGMDVRDICASVLEGYTHGLQAPSPIVMEGEHGWLRKSLDVSDKQRAKFWRNVKPEAEVQPPRRYSEALRSALPDATIELVYGRRTAGIGSLGRPRWIGYGEWRGAPVLREAKAIVPSGWPHAAGRDGEPLRCGEIAGGRYRSPDPWYDLVGTIVIRRLAVSNRKIEAKDDLFAILGPDLLRVMGHDLASTHLGIADRSSQILDDIQNRPREWLRDAAVAAADAVIAEHEAWKG
jgi:Uncharacterized protein conserved in bacteria (DUF2252)